MRSFRGLFHPTTGFTPAGGAPAAAVHTPVYDTDYSAYIRPFVFLVVFGVLALGGYLLVEKSFDYSNYVGCEKVGLCKTTTLARLAKETGVNIDASGNLSFPQRVVQTVTQPAPVIVYQQAPQPVIVQAPQAPAPIVVPSVPPATTGRAKLLPEGRCRMSTGAIGYEWPDRRCHLNPFGTRVNN